MRVASSGRFLVDAQGRPFLIKGETAWLALANLTPAEQERYLADRAGKGFNVVEIMLTNHNYTSPPNPTPPANRAGEQPFLNAGDFSKPNDAYFDRAAAFVDRAAAHGIAVLIAPNYLGFDGGREGWWTALTDPVNTRAVCAAFGRYLGARFEWSEERDKARVKDMFKGYVSDSVVDMLLSSDRRLDLQGQSMHITVLFSDIRQFTTISEKLKSGNYKASAGGESGLHPATFKVGPPRRSSQNKLLLP